MAKRVKTLIPAFSHGAGRRVWRIEVGGARGRRRVGRGDWVLIVEVMVLDALGKPSG
jgi:hypothetical protein